MMPVSRHTSASVMLPQDADLWNFPGMERPLADHFMAFAVPVFMPFLIRTFPLAGWLSQDHPHARPLCPESPYEHFPTPRGVISSVASRHIPVADPITI